jgi:uncharacterized protein
VDCRGRGNSEGEFFPTENDGADGAQVIDWIGKQPWCDGQVAMRGGSYRGMVQWQALMNFPPSLKTIVPTASGAPGIDFPWPSNIGVSYFTQWLGYTAGRTGNENLFGDGKYWSDKFYNMMRARYRNSVTKADLVKPGEERNFHWNWPCSKQLYREFGQGFPAWAE